MERPQSSGIDIPAFSFAKPAAHQKGFSLRAVPKQGLVHLDPVRDASTVETQNRGTRHDDKSLAAKDQYVTCS